MDRTGQAERAMANAGRQSDTTVLVFPCCSPARGWVAHPSATSSPSATSAAARSLDRRTGDRLPPRPRRRCPRRAPGRPVRGSTVCGCPPIPCPHVIRSSVAMASRLALVVDVSRAGSGRPSAAQPGAECGAASSNTPTMHAGPREHKRRWKPAGSAVCRACPACTRTRCRATREDRRRRGRR